jgi:hypothetical protein
MLTEGDIFCMSLADHSLPIHSAPVPTNVGCYSISDHSGHQSELTLCAICVLRCDAKKQQDYFAVSDEPPYVTRCQERAPSTTSIAADASKQNIIR